MYCMNCGNEIDKKNNICHGCGIRIDGKEIAIDTREKKIEDNDRITDTDKKKIRCEHCGNIIKSKKSGIAAVLSFIIPGLGQIYRGRIGIGSIFLMIWLALVELNILLIEDPTFRKIVPDVRNAMVPGIRESTPDIRIIMFIIIYIIFWIYNTHNAYTTNHEEA